MGFPGGGGVLTREYSAILLHIEAMVCREDERNGTEIQVQNGPAERNPEGEGEHHRFREQEVCIVSNE